MNWEELFRDLFDQLFWSGFTEDMKKNEPERYQIELTDFIAMYT